MDSIGESARHWADFVVDSKDSPYIYVGLLVVVALVAAGVVDVLFRKVAMRITAATKTELDDKIIAAVRKPLAVTVLLLGLWSALTSLDVPDPGPFLFRGAFMSIAVLFWTSVAIRLAAMALEFLSEHHERFEIINVRTLPVFEIIVKIVLIGGCLYFLLLAWDVDVTGWLASAGVVGIAVGFAAKDTLANLFAGVFILADAPYKIGDYLVLSSGERGRVTDIGIRSTRLLTRDDIEIIVPNASMANAKIINESGGPYERERVRCNVGVAYGTDIDLLEKVLLEIAYATPHMVIDDPKITPRVRFRELGDSALKFQLMGWIDAPELRGRVLHHMYSQVYKRLPKEGIQIPYPQRVVHFAGAPPGGGEEG